MYQLELFPHTTSEGDVDGGVTFNITAKKPENISTDDHENALIMLLQLQHVFMFFESHPDVYEEFVLWWNMHMTQREQAGKERKQ